MKWIVACAVLGLVSHVSAAAKFTPGDLFAVSNTGRVYNVTAGGDFTNATPFADIGASEIGHIAFSRDLTTMYVSSFINNTVFAIDASGVATPLATNLYHPLGLLMTTDGRLLVVDDNSGGTSTKEVTDITDGGDFSYGGPVFASNVGELGFDLAQSVDGRIFVSDGYRDRILDITAGGPASAANQFGPLLSSLSIEAAPDGGLFATDSDVTRVVKLDANGQPTLVGYNRSLSGVEYTAGGRLLGVDFNTNEIIDITAGGDMTTAPVFATVTGVDSVTSVPLPEPIALCFFLPGARILRRRR